MATIEFKVITSFGCLCCGCLSCQLCGTGRKYTISMKKTETVSSIWDEMIRQNPKIKEKELKPFMYLGREPLDNEKRLINYDFDNNVKVFVIFPPQLCFIKDFRSTPKPKRTTDGEAAGGELERKEQKSMDGGVKGDDSTV
eukprot:Gregarina_sp_Pseudo_9__5688@NODE_80_length_4505_cov_41_104344_g74_i0_p7_GENE_NODE_80_length_4505_cov_41_104344_g74_i0NODE_80_length_4505_cov_41_104344_g74_i0_p7_ORF_typecomplete_len141_score26_87ubiquitin/PF00240_23/0_13_NODE_80_length_4505_cov_41_104344_g74_i038894311